MVVPNRDSYHFVMAANLVTGGVGEADTLSDVLAVVRPEI